MQLPLEKLILQNFDYSANLLTFCLSPSIIFKSFERFCSCCSACLRWNYFYCSNATTCRYLADEISHRNAYPKSFIPLLSSYALLADVSAELSSGMAVDGRDL